MERKEIGRFIYFCRKEKGLSQTELGNIIGVSNKAVSKWETDEAYPESSKLSVLAGALGVSVEELLQGSKFEDGCKTDGIKCSYFGLKGTKIKTETKFEFVSDKKSSDGLPYVHVNFGKENDGSLCRAHGAVAIGCIAKGKAAVGLVSKGIVSVGLISAGLVSIGLLSMGILSVGTFVMGLIAVGAVSLGGIAVGGVAIGIAAVGGVAIGYLSLGGLSVGYHAFTGLGGYGIGKHVHILSSAFMLS